MGIFKLGLSFSGFAIPLLYQLCMAIDAIIYEVADRAIRAFFEMARLSADVQAYSEEIGWILQRVMVLAGIYALFRVAVMLINYMVDPSKVSDASKNGTAIVKNIIIAVVLLMVSPSVFSILGEFQGMIIEENVIPKIVYGPKSFKENEADTLITSQSARFVNNVFLLFFVPDGVDCDGAGKSTSYCMDYNDVKEARKKGNGSFYGVSHLIGHASSKYFTYSPFISGIVGMMLVYYFAVFAIELGKRIIKLIVLQVISPIPIIMSIDPAQKDRISKFVKAYSDVFLQIFIRIITVYLAFVILGLITSSHFGTDAVQSGMLLAQPSWFVKVLLYIGVFQSTKEIPKLIEDAIGVKMGSTPGGGFGKVLTGILGGTAGLVGGTVAGAVGGAAGGGLVAAGAALAGGLTGMLGGATKAMAAKSAVAAAGSTVDSIRGSFGLGGKIGNAGGLFPYMKSGVENFFGADKKDAAEFARFDRLTKEQDDKINDYNSSFGEKEKVDQLRSSVDTALDLAFAASSPERSSLDSYLFANSEYRKLQEAVDKNSRDGFYSANPEYRKIDADRLNAKRAELEQQYKREKENFAAVELSKYQRNIQGAATPGFVPDKVNGDVQKALDEYNEYVAKHDMNDRKIMSYGDGGAYSYENAKEQNDRDKNEINRQIEEANAEKERIKIERKNFENNPNVQARANRNKPRDANPWTRD